jgi:lysophospholipase L1-like esterase
MTIRAAVLKTGVIASLAALASACSTLYPPEQQSGSWVGTWGASPTPPPANAKTFENQTVRQVLRVSTAGNRLRVRLTNEYGDKPLEIGAATISLAATDGAPIGKTLDITFGGSKSTSIPAKSPLLSDPIDLPVKALENISISLFLPSATGPCTCHPQATAVSFISAPGNFTMGAFPPASTFNNRAFISAVEIEPTKPTRVIVTFGDSITDGTRSTNDGNHRWPDVLAERLNAAGGGYSIVNAAISGNRVLSHANAIFGEPALSRLDRDVFTFANVTHMTVLEGINDIGMGRPNPPNADQIVAGYKQIITRAHARGIKVIGGTLLPYEGAQYYAPEGDVIRMAVNDWVRANAGKPGGFDAIIDFDKLMHDPANPKKLKADQQSGDWLHPNDAGYKVMGDAIDLALFR